MRLIGTFHQAALGKRFSAFLTTHQIPHLCENKKNLDWGSEDYGSFFCNIWIYEEDQVEEAKRWLDQFKENPEDPQFFTEPVLHEVSLDTTPPPPPSATDFHEKGQSKGRPTSSLRRSSLASRNLTFYLVLLCGWIFAWGQVTAPPLTSFPAALPSMALFSPPIYKMLLYDYPKAYELTDQLVKTYGFESVLQPNDLPSEGQALFTRVAQTPYWQGVYPYFLPFLDDPSEAMEKMQRIPLFEKIRQGEFWRIFTPCLLHSDFVHILFNMIWLIVLGRQIESRLGSFRYGLFILLSAIFSNTMQYFMSGPNFLGISGVLCAMLTFVWMRQKKAPWEGYDLQSATFGLMMFFILAMAAFQVVSFFVEWFWKVSFSPLIANTAHLSGAFIGAFLGSLRFFKWKATL